MATQSKVVINNTTTNYVIADAEGNTVTVTLVQTFGGGRLLTFVSAGGLHQDGQLVLTTLMQLLSTGLTP
jgi:hypothetical protein